MSTAAVKAYTASQTSTASPARLLVMLYERLIVDLESGADAIDARDFSVAHEKLIHAQDILVELPSVIDMTGWEGEDATHAIYAYALAEAVAANTHKDAGRSRRLVGVLAPLLAAWREAAASVVPEVAA